MQQVEQPAEPLPPNVNIILHWIGRFYFWITGWKVVGESPHFKQFVATAGPHTSNWDGLQMLTTSWIIRHRIDWMLKKELTKGPLGWILTSLGAVPVDRSRGFNLVDQMVEQFQKRDRLALAIPPEGTRRKTDHWKTGFYWIADKADVPILIAYVDYKNKEVNIASGFWKTSGDIEADMPTIWEYYSKGNALHPEKVSDMRLRPIQIKRHGAESEAETAEEFES